MYTLYIANKNYSSWSLRPWLLLAQLEIPFEEKQYRFADGVSSGQFREFSPTGLVPCLVDGDTTVWESLAIVEYVAEQYPRVWPTDPRARAWARSASAEMHANFSALRNECPMSLGIRMRLHQISDSLRADIERIQALWNEGLTKFGGPFLAGAQFTAVDAFFAPVCFRIQSYGLDIDQTCRDYMTHILQLPAMQAWTEAGLAETFREPLHEDEIAALGTITEDLRAT